MRAPAWRPPTRRRRWSARHSNHPAASPAGWVQPEERWSVQQRRRPACCCPSPQPRSRLPREDAARYLQPFTCGALPNCHLSHSKQLRLIRDMSWVHAGPSEPQVPPPRFACPAPPQGAEEGSARQTSLAMATLPLSLWELGMIADVQSAHAVAVRGHATASQGGGTGMMRAAAACRAGRRAIHWQRSRAAGQQQGSRQQAAGGSLWCPHVRMRATTIGQVMAGLADGTQPAARARSRRATHGRERQAGPVRLCALEHSQPTLPQCAYPDPKWMRRLLCSEAGMPTVPLVAGTAAAALHYMLLACLLLPLTHPLRLPSSRQASHDAHQQAKRAAGLGARRLSSGLSGGAPGF